MPLGALAPVIAVGNDVKTIALLSFMLYVLLSLSLSLSLCEVYAVALLEQVYEARRVTSGVYTLLYHIVVDISHIALSFT